MWGHTYSTGVPGLFSLAIGRYGVLWFCPSSRRWLTVFLAPGVCMCAVVHAGYVHVCVVGDVVVLVAGGMINAWCSWLVMIVQVQTGPGEAIVGFPTLTSCLGATRPVVMGAVGLGPVTGGLYPKEGADILRHRGAKSAWAGVHWARQ